MMGTLKRPTQAQQQQIKTPEAPAAAPASAPVGDARVEALKAHPLFKIVEKRQERLTAEEVVEAMNRSPWNRDVSAIAVSLLEVRGFARDAAADKARGDGTVVLAKDEGDKRVVIKIKQHNERTGCYRDEYPLRREQAGGTSAPTNKTFRIKVRQYMTKPTEPGSDFDFQAKYNENKPMPMRVMVGEVLEETRGMYRMSLHGRPEPSSYCLHCGRTLNHPVSVLYGIGPVCGEHCHINPLASEAELQAVMDEIKQKLAAITWTGWVIKSAIEEMDEIKEEAGA